MGISTEEQRPGWGGKERRGKGTRGSSVAEIRGKDGLGIVFPTAEKYLRNDSHSIP
jgi:hypothetical protein